MEINLRVRPLYCPKMKKNSYINALKIILIISMLIFLYNYNTYKTNPCHHCEFIIGEEEYSMAHFMKYYERQCFTYKGLNPNMALHWVPFNETIPVG